jgi:sulfopyruvate decarboxylase subunit alpha
VNGIVSCAQLYRIPLLMLISHRGEFRRARSRGRPRAAGVTEHVLQALRIPYAYLDRRSRRAPHSEAQTLAYSSNKPVRCCCVAI